MSDYERVEMAIYTSFFALGVDMPIAPSAGGAEHTSSE